MRQATATLESISPLSWSRRYLDPPREEKEGPADYERRTWKERFHYNSDGQVFIPPMAFKGCIENAAAYLGIKIKGRGNATYSKHFRSGIIVPEPLVLPVSRDEVQGEWFFVPSDGKPGGKSRVDKCFPVIQQWKGDVTFMVLDETITQPIFQRHLEEAGSFIGVGRFRPQNRGFYGRFKVNKIVWN